MIKARPPSIKRICPIKLEKFFNLEDKLMKLQGLSVTDWISDN
jgi:hypothetical protein